MRAKPRTDTDRAVTRACSRERLVVMHVGLFQDNGEEEEEVDLYERLGLQPEATDREIKSAYRRAIFFADCLRRGARRNRG